MWADTASHFISVLRSNAWGVFWLLFYHLSQDNELNKFSFKTLIAQVKFGDLTIRQQRRLRKCRWKNRLPIISLFFAIFQGAQLLKRLEGTWVGGEEKGLRPSSDRDGRIYRLAIQFPSKLKPRHAFPFLFENEDFFLRFQKNTCPYEAYSNRFRPSIRKR